MSPNSSVKAAPTTSCRIWCPQANQSICQPRSCSSVQAPLWIPVLEEVVSNVFVMHRILFSFSCTSTTASLFTFPNPPRSERSFPSKLICPGLQENCSLIVFALCDRSATLCRRAVDLDRDSSPPPWFVIAATTVVSTLLDRFNRSAAGPSFLGNLLRSPQ